MLFLAYLPIKGLLGTIHHLLLIIAAFAPPLQLSQELFFLMNNFIKGSQFLTPPLLEGASKVSPCVRSVIHPFEKFAHLVVISPDEAGVPGIHLVLIYPQVEQISYQCLTFSKDRVT